MIRVHGEVVDTGTTWREVVNSVSFKLVIKHFQKNDLI